MSPPEDLETLARAEPAADDEADGRRRRGNRTRESILQAAADLASVEGLEGLTIGRLATELGMSKSGLFAHFGSKEELQLATIGAARQRFVEHVVKPSRSLPRGRARLEALHERLARLLPQRGVRRRLLLPRRQGGVRQPPGQRRARGRPPRTCASSSALLTREVRKAQEAGDLDPAVEPEQLAFEIDALGAAANQQYQLMQDPAAFDRAETAIRARLDSVSLPR